MLKQPNTSRKAPQPKRFEEDVKEESIDEGYSSVEEFEPPVQDPTTQGKIGFKTDEVESEYGGFTEDEKPVTKPVQKLVLSMPQEINRPRQAENKVAKPAVVSNAPVQKPVSRGKASFLPAKQDSGSEYQESFDEEYDDDFN